MTNYYCECCNYNAKQKSNYEKHLKTKKHQLASSNVQFFKQNEPFFKQNVPFFDEKVVNLSKKTPYQCKYCLKYFKYSQGLSRHINIHVKIMMMKI